MLKLCYALIKYLYKILLNDNAENKNTVLYISTWLPNFKNLFINEAEKNLFRNNGQKYYKKSTNHQARFLRDISYLGGGI